MSCLRPVVLLITLMLTLSACSRLEFAYEYGDWFAARRVASYLDLDRDQRRDVRMDLQAYRDFHRAERLPELVALMDDAESLLDDPEASRDELEASFDAGEVLLRAKVEDLIPFAAATLRSLSPAQIAHLEQQLADGRTEYAEEIAPAGASRVIERVESWTGDLSAGQRERFAACHGRLPDVADQWLQWRARRDQQFVSLLGGDPSPAEVETFLREWWLDAESRPEPLRRARTDSREVWLDCAHGLLAGLSDRQRSSIRGRLQGYRDDFSALAAR